MQDYERSDVVAARAQHLSDWEALPPRVFLQRQVVTAEATRRLKEAKDRGLVDVKPVTLDELNLTKVKGEKPTDAEVAPVIEWVKSKLERDPMEKVLAAAEKEWTAIVTPTDDFDFVGRLRFRRNEGCPVWTLLRRPVASFSNGRKDTSACAGGSLAMRSCRTSTSLRTCVPF
jgi:hypothetical protein